MIDKNTDDNNIKIKKIIDPKSGFALYLREFSDSSISQVSSVDTFPIPSPSEFNPSTNTIDMKLLTNELSDIKKETTTIINKQQTIINQLNKKIKC